ncbi:sugar phosphate isomerase/epimerase family protein [Patulibacter americanus]|uniref:sugar phosphate isomerase/epimerase family protein n=1 Tax=Patulibacter americanus TaxID=588672 RepID=UPI001B7F8B1E|nr:sugar phosphate isomerase/epimerase [Patulibacter americanus]
MLPPERVFGEMAQLGLQATELGPVDDYLALDAEAIRDALEPHGLRLVGGFVPLVLHGPDITEALEQARRIGGVMAAAGADTFVLAIIADADWSAPPALNAEDWVRIGRHVDEVAAAVAELGLTLAVHPHQGTLIEEASDVQRLLETSTAGWCLDPGHLVIGGFDPVDFVRLHGDRIVHVHLKDVDRAIVTRLRAGELSLMEAVQAGLFRPLGRGDGRIAEVLELLREQGYGRWMVLEQDTAITGQEPPVGSGPINSVRESLAFLDTTAPEREEVRR